MIYSLSLHDALPISAAVANPDIVAEAAAEFGSEKILVAIDAKKITQGNETDAWSVFTQGGRKDAGLEAVARSEEHTSELQSRGHIVCRLVLENKQT